MSTLPLDQAITRFQQNEERVETFVNEEGTYTTSSDEEVETLPSLMQRLQTRYLSVVSRGAWTTSTAYSINDLVLYGTENYLCVVGHSAGVFATDLSNGKWLLYHGVSSEVLAGEDGADQVGYGTDFLPNAFKKTVKKYGAVGDGLTNDTAAFTAARAATGGVYFIPPGTYVVDASPDPFADAFAAGENTYLKISGVTYNISNSFCGPLRYVQASFQKTDIRHAKTGAIIMYMQDGSSGTATGFYRGLAFTTDSHWVQAQPATVGGSTDMLWQRSVGHADSGGNRFNTTFEESVDRLLHSFATSASGSPAFDTYMAVIAGTSPSLVFPAIQADFKQGWVVQTRSLGALRYALVPTSAVEATYRDETTGNVLAKVNKTRTKTAGISFDTMLIVPTGIYNPVRWGAVYSDLGGDGSLPVTVNLWDSAGATRNIVMGTLRVAAQPSGAAGNYRESRFTFDGTTVTMTDLVNTLHASITASITASSGVMSFSGSYTGALGAGMTMAVDIEFVAAGR